MRHANRTSANSRRSARGAVNAQAILALLAMTAAASVWSGPIAVESRAPMTDTAKVRAVAAVVKAVARDLFRADQTVADIALSAPDASILSAGQPVVIEVPVCQLPVGTILAERLLDLPPPVC